MKGKKDWDESLANEERKGVVGKLALGVSRENMRIRTYRP